MFDDGCADFRSATAAIFQKETDQRTQIINLGAIDDGAALSLAAHKIGTRHDIEMRGKSVGGDGQLLGQVACTHAFRLSGHEQAKHIEPRGLGEGGKSKKSLI